MNIEYKQITNFYECLKLWNDEVGNIYPIGLDSFENNVASYDKKEGLGAFVDNELVGFIILKEFYNDYVVTFNDCLLISLIYVSSSYRRQGIGSKLVDYALKKADGKEIWVGREIKNFFPGIPCDFDNLTDTFFKEKGFKVEGISHDLILHDPRPVKLRNENVQYKLCSCEEKEELVEFIKRNNWKRWAYEASTCFSEHNYVIGKIDGKIVSFARINNLFFGATSYNMMWKGRFNNLGGIGPLGVDANYRKLGLGYDIVAQAINELLNYKVSDIMIDWTGLMEFYQKLGFEVWKTYQYTHKERK